MAYIEPLFFQPLLKPTIWGGDRLAGFKHFPPTRGIGESWEISALSGNETHVAAGHEEGRTLPELIETYGAALMGAEVMRRYGSRFPLLVKFIDSAQDLSIQVHPSDAMAHRVGFPNGKTEMWYVLESEPEASLVAGFRQTTTVEACRHSIENGTLMQTLARHTTHAGDCFFIPAGRIHSIGAGNLLVEIQQSMDVTYRVYDFGRVDREGHERPLHIEQALEALDYEAQSDYRTHYALRDGSPADLVRCPYFTVRRWSTTQTVRADREGADSFSILVATEGSALLRDAEGSEFGLMAGQTVLIPAATKHVDIVPDAASTFGFLEVYIA